MARPAAASSPEAKCGRRRDISHPSLLRTVPRLRRPRRDDGKWSRTYLFSLSTVNGVPHPIGRGRHFELVVTDRIRDGVDHGGRSADRAGLAAAFDAERIAR